MVSRDIPQPRSEIEISTQENPLGTVVVGGPDTSILASLAIARATEIIDAGGLASEGVQPGGVRITSSALQVRFGQSERDVVGTLVDGSGNAMDVPEDILDQVIAGKCGVAVRVENGGSIDASGRDAVLALFDRTYLAYLHEVSKAEQPIPGRMEVITPVRSRALRRRLVPMLREEYLLAVAAAGNVPGISVANVPLGDVDDYERAVLAVLRGFEQVNSMLPRQSHMDGDLLHNRAIELVDRVRGARGDEVLVSITATSESGRDGTASFMPFEGELRRLETHIALEDARQGESVVTPRDASRMYRVQVAGALVDFLVRRPSPDRPGAESD